MLSASYLGLIFVFLEKGHRHHFHAETRWRDQLLAVLYRAFSYSQHPCDVGAVDIAVEQGNVILLRGKYHGQIRRYGRLANPAFSRVNTDPGADPLKRFGYAAALLEILADLCEPGLFLRS